MDFAFNNFRKMGGIAACALVLLSAGAFLFYHLGNEPLQDYDEATYAEVVHEAMANHEYLSFTYGGANYFKKPPLMFWAMAASESVFGETTFAMRLPFVVCGIAAIASLMLLLYEVAGDWWAAALGGAVLGTVAPFMETARQVRFDVPVVLCIVLAVYFFMRALKDRRWLLAFGAAVGFAVLAKSVIALFAPVAAVLVIFLYRRFDLFTDKYAYGSVAVALLIAAPWHVWEWAQFGNAFWSQYIGVEVVSRAQENLFWTVSITNADYVHYLLEFTQPWLWVFVAALVGAIVAYKWLPQHNRRFIAVSAGTIAVMLAVFFTAKTKAPTYLMPVYPFAAGVIALAAASIRGRITKIGIGICAAVLILFGAYSTYYNAYHHNPYYSIELDMATDEHAIGEQLKGVPQNIPIYVYDDENLGSVEFYSQHTRLYQLAATSTAPAAGYVLVDTSGLPMFATTFPQVQSNVLYTGPQVSLLQIKS